MQKTLAAVTVAALVGVAGSANAADIYAGGGGGLKDAYVPVSTWTGFHVGLGVGAEALDHKVVIGDPVTFDGISSTGVIGTVEVGYDRQYGNLVVGLFFNYDFGDNVATTLEGAGLDIKVAQTDSWTVGGRVGYLVNPSTMAYVLGGYTETTLELQGVTGISWNPTLDGWTVGGGLETKLGGNWTAKAEYRYTEYNSVSPIRNVPVSVETSEQSARLVLSYKFDLFGSDPLK
jgi:outer membrane immunogenic protein